MIAPTPFFADRGCHVQIYEEIKALQRENVEVVLCTYGMGRDVPGVEIVRCLNLPWYRKLSAGPSLTKILLLPFLTVTVIRTILRFKPDIIHAHLHEGAFIARFCRIFFKNPKYLFDMQGSLTGELLQHGFIRKGGLRHKFFSFLERKISGWFFVITQSESMMKELASLGVPIERRRNVHDGVDTDVFYPREFPAALAGRLGIDRTKPRVLYMGLLESYQGADLMFQAFRIVAAQIPQTQFIVIGYPNIEKYKTLCDQYGIAALVKFLGRVDYALLPEYLALSQIALAPKIAVTEGDGKIYNYMAMGMATVAFDRSVSREILDDCGFYAHKEDAEALSEKITEAIKTPDLCRRMGEKARQRAVAHLSWAAVGRRIHRVYRQLLGRSSGKDGEIPTDIKKCRICDGPTKILFEDGADFFLLDGRSPAFGVRYCQSCGIGYSFPPLRPEDFSTYYPDDFEAYVPKKTFWGFLQKIKYESDLKRISKHLKPGQRSLFEVGAGRGEFLHAAKDRGFEVAGVEPGVKGVHFSASQYGIQLQEGFASEMRFERSYDVVVARHVLEHLDGFYECLEKIYQEGLAQGGILFLKLPRLDSWEAKCFGRLWRGFDLPRHRVHFTKFGLIKILSDIGFYDIVFRGEVVPSDIAGSIGYYSRHGKSWILRGLARLFDLLPQPLKFMLGQLVGCLLSPWGAGRMIVVARKR
jgi:glycosyltransferase involved in cell wall biosynthesis